MTFTTFDRVVLDCDLPEKGLRRGDIGIVVELLPPEGLALEFFNVLGETRAVAVIPEAAVRPPHESNMLAVSQAAPTSA